MLSRRDVLQRAALLLGGSLGSTAITGLLSGCRANPSPGWQPEVLSATQAATLAAMLDHLLPKTSTPSATELLVDRFVDAMLKDYATDAERQTFLAGLDEAETNARARYGAAFAEIAPTARDEMFQAWEAAAPPAPPTIWGGQISDTVAPLTFYRHFKQLAVIGYYASEQIGEHVLNYDPIPGTFEGCVPAETIGNAWSL